MKTCKSIEKIASLLAECGQKIKKILNTANLSAKIRKFVNSKLFNIVLPLSITFIMILSLGHSINGDNTLLEAVFADGEFNSNSSYSETINYTPVTNPVFHLMADNTITSIINECDSELTQTEIVEQEVEDSREGLDIENSNEDTTTESYKKEKLRAYFASLFSTITEFSGEIAKKRKKDMEMKDLERQDAQEKQKYSDVELRVIENTETNKLYDGTPFAIDYERS